MTNTSDPFLEGIMDKIIDKKVQATNNTSDTSRTEEQLYRIAEMAMGQQENWGISERTFWDAVKRSLASLSARNAVLAEALSLARTVIVVACGEKAPYAKIAIGRIDAALAAEQPPPRDTP